MSQRYLPNRMKGSGLQASLLLSPQIYQDPRAPKQPPTAALQCPCTSISAGLWPLCGLRALQHAHLSRRTRTLCLPCPHIPPPRSRTAWWSSLGRCPTKPPQTLCGTWPGHQSEPEVYERRVCFLLLQLCDGLEHLKEHGIITRPVPGEPAPGASPQASPSPPRCLHSSHHHIPAPTATPSSGPYGHCPYQRHPHLSRPRPSRRVQ